MKRRLITPVYAVEPDSLDKEDAVPTVYIGWDHCAAAYWIQTLCGKDAEFKRMTYCIGWRYRQALSKLGGKHWLAILESDCMPPSDINEYNFLEIPFYIDAALDVTPTMDDLCRPSKSSINRMRRKVRNNNFSHTVTDNWEDYVSFIENMCLPYINQKYGRATLDIRPGRNHPAAETKGLIKIIKDDQMIAGLTIRDNGKELRLCQLGVLNGNPEYVRQGAYEAGYYFGISEAKRRGRKTVNLGGVRPLMTDRITQYKRRVRGVMQPSIYKPDKQLVLIPLSKSLADTNFFNLNPMAQFDSKMKPVMTVEAKSNDLPDPASLLSIIKQNLSNEIMEVELLISDCEMTDESTNTLVKIISKEINLPVRTRPFSIPDFLQHH